MAHPILVSVKLTAGSANMLSATDLAQIPWPGRLHIYIASTVNTATAQFPNLNPSVPAVAQAVPLWVNGVPQVKDLIPWVLPAAPGNPPLIVLAGTTGTVYGYFLLVPGRA